jgi:hypothetical protein
MRIFWSTVVVAVLTFHDSSLEAIATDLVVVDSFVSMAEAVTEMVR